MIFLSDTKIDYGHYLDLYILFNTKLLINPLIPKLYAYHGMYANELQSPDEQFDRRKWINMWLVSTARQQQQLQQ